MFGAGHFGRKTFHSLRVIATDSGKPPRTASCKCPSITTTTVLLALEWIPEGGRRRVGRPKRTWQDTLKEDLDILGVDWSDARDTANDRARWRQLVAQCSAQNGRN